MSEAPDAREQDCPGPFACHSTCDLHEGTPDLLGALAASIERARLARVRDE